MLAYVKDWIVVWLSSEWGSCEIEWETIIGISVWPEVKVGMKYTGTEFIEDTKEIVVGSITNLIAKKRAMEIVWENTDAIVEEITLTAEEYIDSTDISAGEKETLKSSILEKL